MLTRMAMEKEKNFKNKVVRGGGTGRAGGLKRLGFRNSISGVPLEDQKKVGLKQIDIQVARDNKKAVEARQKADAELTRNSGGSDNGAEVGMSSKRTGLRGRLVPTKNPIVAVSSSVDAPTTEVDFARTLTLRTKTRREKNRAAIAERLEHQAKMSEVTAVRRHEARAAAHNLPNIEDSEVSAD